MSIIQAIFLGIIQGITEFLPISSSGHLMLGQYFLGLHSLDDYIFFDLICHLGTLGAIFFIYAKEIRNLFTTDRTRLQQIIIATLPLFPIVLVLKQIEALYDQMVFLGVCFLITSLLLFAGTYWQRVRSQSERKKSWRRDAFLIGLFQVFALLPGVSRSGSTISGASILGWGRQEAVTFSFLLVIPAVLGGTSLKLMQLFFQEGFALPAIGVGTYFAGFITSFVVGCFSLLLLIRLASKGKLVYFAWYCLVLGLGTIFYFFF